MRLLFLTLEFTAGTFSGNGVYAQSQVRALSQLGHDVVVISAKPAKHTDPVNPCGASTLLEVPVSRWGQLDASAPWHEYAEGCKSPTITQLVSRVSFEAVLGVDWTSLPAYRTLKPCLQGNPSFLYLNYRVFSRTASDEDAGLVRRLEIEAVAEGIDTLVLSRSDADYIHQNLLPANRQGFKPKVLLPALRADMQQIPSVPTVADPEQRQPCSSSNGTVTASAVGQHAKRRFLSCCVRLSPEKEPDRFVDIVRELAHRGVLQRHGLVPLLCGSSKSEYAEALKAQLRASVPAAVIEERFLGPQELAELYRQTYLNLHPCSYDAYGMTIVEAASQGAPSLANMGGAIGATDLLSAEHEEILVTDMAATASALADVVEEILRDEERLQRVAAKAEAKARSWDEQANAQALTDILAARLLEHHSKQTADSHL